MLQLQVSPRSDDDTENASQSTMSPTNTQKLTWKKVKRDATATLSKGGATVCFWLFGCTCGVPNRLQFLESKLITDKVAAAIEEAARGPEKIQLGQHGAIGVCAAKRNSRRGCGCRRRKI